MLTRHAKNTREFCTAFGGFDWFEQCVLDQCLSWISSGAYAPQVRLMWSQWVIGSILSAYARTDFFLALSNAMKLNIIQTWRQCTLIFPMEVSCPFCCQFQVPLLSLPFASQLLPLHRQSWVSECELYWNCVPQGQIFEGLGHARHQCLLLWCGRPLFWCPLASQPYILWHPCSDGAALKHSEGFMFLRRLYFIMVIQHESIHASQAEYEKANLKLAAHTNSWPTVEYYLA